MTKHETVKRAKQGRGRYLLPWIDSGNHRWAPAHHLADAEAPGRTRVAIDEAGANRRVVALTALQMEKYNAWFAGEGLIQDLFPELSVNERKIILAAADRLPHQVPDFTCD